MRTDMTMNYEYIDPEMAAMLLETNDNNRKISANTVASYVYDIINGNWDEPKFSDKASQIPTPLSIQQVQLHLKLVQLSPNNLPPEKHPMKTNISHQQIHSPDLGFLPLALNQ